MQARSVAPEPIGLPSICRPPPLSGHPQFWRRGLEPPVRGDRVLTGLEAAVVIFEVLSVLILRAHSTMDVFTGLGTGLYAARLAEQVAS
jgi:hypothetical protein